MENFILRRYNKIFCLNILPIFNILINNNNNNNIYDNININIKINDDDNILYIFNYGIDKIDYINKIDGINNTIIVFDKKIYDILINNKNNRTILINSINININDVVKRLNMYDVTVVTALYDIGRSKNDNRTIDQYFGWLKDTVRINEPMVIYLDKNLDKKIYNKIKEIRKNKLTKIVETELNQIPCYHMNDKVKNIIEEKEWKKKCKYPNDITNTNSLYVCIQYSKFEWMLNSIKIINWNTNNIMWMDAGISRFLEIKDNTHTLNISDDIIYKNKFVIQGYEPQNINYYGTNKCMLKGTIFISNKDILKEIIKKVNEKINYMLSNNIIDNEQIALAMIYLDDKKIFHLINNGPNHLNKIWIK